ncbi:hypothetical protein GCK32_011147 [Trichostrongylus colubriformis]|uniref:Uncharacterized protein n=1 Tax=Trichostrongylus colubriformis TaxID=6319 RepID=A0AAN8IEG0_TRICO
MSTPTKPASMGSDCGPEDVLRSLDKGRDKIRPDVARVAANTKSPQNNLKRKMDAPAPCEYASQEKPKTKEILDEILDRLTAIEEYLEVILAHLTRISKGDRKMAASPPSTITKKEWTCIFCDGYHYSSDCTTYTTLSARRRKCFEKNRCERCLMNANHMATSCISKSACYHCKMARRDREMDKHNTAFCPYNFVM